ncbi:hypothetical protein [Flavobacterium sp. UMI-01]|uniref:hypothetical protein n=1 Tax=Flavobacterium sp. UMI-01 TaxID=1441053 RepID=UPI001C7D19CE|nr:hypothetical protein [Flavobacterium sp. UMI-01]GIZ08849.1 hypothetical protein FUMI01_15760 [Flavobacterium sp. UMI-01]
MEKEKWINEIIDSTNHIVKVLPSDGLYAKIQTQMNVQKTIDIKWVWLVAASILILASINIKVVLNEIQSVKETEKTALVASLSDTNQFYKNYHE